MGFSDPTSRRVGLVGGGLWAAVALGLVFSGLEVETSEMSTLVLGGRLCT